tara:strand:+ start:372 stop:608 length:237 start_codon:yes stop_codon:yes gene_type:complete
MTKEQEILERHLGCVLQTCYIKRNETAYKACLRAVNEALTIPVATQRSELLLFADYSESDKVSQTTDECVDNYLDQKQ